MAVDLGTVIYAAAYRGEYHAARQSVAWMLTYQLQGVQRWEMTLPGGRRFVSDGRYPLIALVPPGAVSALDAAPDRLDWTVEFESPMLAFDPQRQEAMFQLAACAVPVPLHVAVPEHLTRDWKAKFQTWVDCFKHADARRRLLLHLGLMEAIAFLLSETPPAADSIAARFRQAIENDVTATQNLDTLANRCGYSPNYLRIRFEQEYHLTPVAYRQRLRLAQAIDLLAHSSLSVAAIAAACGFSHTSHFSMAFRKAYGYSPREAIRRHRLTPPGEDAGGGEGRAAAPTHFVKSGTGAGR